MAGYVLVEPATGSNFDETAYLAANPDVAQAVGAGELRSARQHFESFGCREGRQLRRDHSTIAQAKAVKLRRLDPLLRTDMTCRRTDRHVDFLTDELRSRFDIGETDAVSSNDYDGQVLELIDRHATGLILDCGAGRRNVYFDNVVNFEIAAYDTTDVRGVGEELPFRDNVFEAVISIAVLEHVKDPFRCAREIARVLKPGGDLICCVPFLQPYHGYPNHYYNMTHQGLRNLFEGMVHIDRIEVFDSVLPIWSLTWIAHSWAGGLDGAAREEFLALTIRELLEPAPTLLGRRFVRELTRAKNLELASATVLLAHK